jgi:poly-gamma-glutamate synthesis protein (capsule biosynthesis protein)
MNQKKASLLFLVLLGLSIAGTYAQWRWQIFHFGPKNTLTQRSSSDGDFFDYFAPPKEPETTEITFLAAGDIMLSRNVARRMVEEGKDGFLPFRNVDDLLHSTDFNFANLESPFSGSDQYIFKSEFIFNAPTWARSGLNQYNFKILSLANNHILNQEKAGLDYTIKYLAEAGLTGVGAGKNLDEAWQGKTFSAKGVTVGFIAAVYPQGGEANKLVAQITDTDRLTKSIAELKTRADFVVVSMHAGEEYTRLPTQPQVDFAHAAIDAGADIVIGGHPHWVQTTEQYKGKYIFYSLGNFIFDQMFSQDTREGLTLKITLEKQAQCGAAGLSPTGQQEVVCSDSLQGTRLGATLKQIELVPIIIDDYCCARPANESETQNILKKIGVTNRIVTP